MFLALALCASALELDVPRALAQLSADAVDARAEAERWLAVHLKASDFDLAAETAKSSGLEARTRLTRALGSDERHFELAVLLFVDAEPELSRIGADAMFALAERWFGAEAAEPWNEKRVSSELAGRFAGIVSIQPFLDDPDTVIDRLARLAPDVETNRVSRARLEIVVDPGLYVQAIAGTSAAATAAGERDLVRSGAFEVVLFRTIADLRATAEGFGFDGPHPWLRVGYGADMGRKNGPRAILEWCRDVLQYPDRPRGEGAARALAACGWPAPLEWLERRWQSYSDRNALHGVLLAAGRGRVVASLANAAAVDALLAEVSAARELAPSFDSFARRVGTALARCPRIGLDGEELGARVIAAQLWTTRSTAQGTSSFGAEGSAYTAAILAGLGGARGEYGRAMRARLSEPLADDDRAGAVERFELLRMFASRALPLEGLPRVELSRALLALTLERRAELQLAAWMQTLRARPSAPWATRERAQRLDDAQLAVLIELWLACDEPRAAAELVRAWSSANRAPALLGERLAARARLGDEQRVRALLTLARDGAAGDQLAAVERLELLAGVASRDRRQAAARAVLARGSVAFDDWPLVGALAGTQGCDELLEFLIAHAKRVIPIEKSLDAPWLAALARASQDLLARDEQLLSRRIEQELDSALRRSPKHPLRKAREERAWPNQPGPAPTSFEALDPRP